MHAGTKRNFSVPVWNSGSRTHPANVAADGMRRLMTMQAASIRRRSSAYGPGIRYCIFFQGCRFACPGCRYVGTWNPKGGFPKAVNAILGDIKHTHGIDGVTLSGGEPLYQWQSCLQLARGVEKLHLNLWLYTGYTWEQILEDRNLALILPSVDVLVDGQYRFDLPEAEWRGSSNQRLIDVKESLRRGTVTLWKGDRHETV